MNGVLIQVMPDGSLHRTSVEYDQIVEGEPPLELLQKLVGGWIEPVTIKWCGKMRQAFVDEEGKMKRLPFNEMASTLYVEQHGPVDVIFGPMVIWIPPGKSAAKHRLHTSKEASV